MKLAESTGPFDTLLSGESDRLIPPVYAQTFKAGIPNAELTIIPRAGHAPHLEQTEATMDAIAGL